MDAIDVVKIIEEIQPYVDEDSPEYKERLLTRHKKVTASLLENICKQAGFKNSLEIADYVYNNIFQAGVLSTKITDSKTCSADKETI